MKRFMLRNFLSFGLILASCSLMAYDVISFNPDDVFISTDPADVDQLDVAVGISGYKIEDFEDENLIPGLTYQNHNAENNVIEEMELGTTHNNSLWDGIQYMLGNVNVGDAIFRMADGVDSFGVGIADIESDVKLFVNGMDYGLLKDLPNFINAGASIAQLKQVYIRIDRQSNDDPITEVRFRQTGSRFGDIIFFDHLAVFPNANLISCIGPKTPFDKILVLKNKSKRSIPIEVEIYDADGFFVTDADVSAPPIVNVIHNGTTYGDGVNDDGELLPKGAANTGNMLSFNIDTQQWKYILGTAQFQAPGTYEVTFKSGDESTYIIDNGCTQSFERLE